MKHRFYHLTIGLACLSALAGCTHSPQKQPPRQSLAWILQTAESDRPDPLLDITHMLGGIGEDPPLLLLERVELQDATLTDLRAAASDGTLWFEVENKPCFSIDETEKQIRAATWMRKPPFYRIDTQKTRYSTHIDNDGCVTRFTIFNKEKMSLEYNRPVLEKDKKSR